jgi:hypothetical protein
MARTDFTWKPTFALPKIPYGGFSPVRLERDVRLQPGREELV